MRMMRNEAKEAVAVGFLNNREDPHSLFIFTLHTLTLSTFH
jgi:hypothetical protein